MNKTAVLALTAVEGAALNQYSAAAILLTEMSERDRPRSGPCLYCRSEADDQPNFPDLPAHIRTNHVDLVEPVAELMIQVAQLKRQIQGLSSR